MIQLFINYIKISKLKTFIIDKRVNVKLVTCSAINTSDHYNIIRRNYFYTGHFNLTVEE